MEDLFTWMFCWGGNVFKDCTVVKAFGPFAVGDHFDRAVVDEKRRTISIDRDKGGLPWVGKLRFTVEVA